MTGGQAATVARTMDRALAATMDYLACPGPTGAAAARDAIAEHPEHAVEVDFEARAHRLLDAGDAGSVVTLFRQHLPSVLLSPGAHLALATAFEQLGERAQAEREREVARLGVEAVTESGDGSSDRPWVVLRVGDEYEVLAALGRRVTSQRLGVSQDGELVDELTCDDGSVCCFVLAAPLLGGDA